jgi:hypothetical protein
LDATLSERAEYRKWGRASSNDPDVHGTLTTATLIVLDVELDLLSFLEGVELTPRKRRMVKEDFAAILGANEGKSAVTDNADYWPLRHAYTPRARSDESTARCFSTSSLQ